MYEVENVVDGITTTTSFGLTTVYFLFVSFVRRLNGEKENLGGPRKVV
jgi:hypothetical protein